MTKGDLVSAVAKAAGLNKSVAGEAVDAIFDSLARAIKKDKRFQVPGFGTFTVKRRAGRVGRNPQTGEPTFVVVHAKIARGAFARWLITHRIQDTSVIPQFDDLGYRFNPGLSTPGSPAYVCETFGGKGLSIRLQEGKQNSRP